MKRPHLPLLFALPLFLLASCITEDTPADTRRGNFEALWQAFDEHYCFFDEKQVDWNAVHARYAARIDESMTDEQLFDVLAEMTKELRDGHVNLFASHDVARYGAWFDDYPANFSDSLERIYLGRTDDYKQTGTLRYRILRGNIGYVRCSTFQSQFGDGNLSEMMRQLALCNGLIVDVRNNSGGLLTAAQKLASLFINETTTLGYMQHKTGRAHDALSAPEAIRQKPFTGLRWQKPVCVLTNRRCYSAANSFVMFVKGLPGVTVIGDRTGGGAGLPFSSELPNGWSVRFSACPMLDRDLRCTESGIEPDLRVDISPADYARDFDTILEAALARLAAANAQSR